MHFYNKSLLFVTYTLIYLIALTKQTDTNDAKPSQPTLIDSSDYIVVFKPNIPTISIKNQIQKLNLLQVNSNTNGTTNNTAQTINHNITDSTKFNSIGKFRWYSARFKSAEVEEILSNNKPEKDDAVHYWIKDASFSLQEFVQTNPPSWVKKKKSYSKKV